MPLARRVRLVLDTRHIRLEGNATEILLATSPVGEQRAGEDYRLRMILRIAERILEGPGPGVVAVRDAVEVLIRIDAAPDVNESRGNLRGIEAEFIVDSRRIACRVRGARPDSCRNRAAILEVPDLIREHDVVRVGRPRYAGAFAGGRVRGMKIMRQVVSCETALGTVGIPLYRCEPVRTARHHEAGLAGGHIPNRDLQPVFGIDERDDQLITPIHQECIGIGRYKWP